MEEQQPEADTNRALQIKTFVVGLGATEAIDLIAHGGLPGAVFAAGAAAILAVKSPEIVAPFRDFLPPIPVWGGRSLVDRMLGRYPDELHEEEEYPQELMESLQPRLVPEINFDGEDELAAPSFAPEGPFYFSQVLKTFKPSLEKIYLGSLPDGKPVFISARTLCHTALAGATRGGKDHLIRMLMSQLCYAGAKCYLLNPNYTRYDLESFDPYGRPYPEDWTPFEQWLKNDPRNMIPRDRKYKVIEHYLAQAYDKVEERLEMYGNSEKKLGAPHFLFINEIPAIVEEVPATAKYLKKILREGAKVGVFMVNASQDFHVTTIFKDVGGGIRKCYRTAFDVGSDPATQSALGLPVAKGLGKGKVSLRCDDIASGLRVPYVDNDALYMLLGPSTYSPGMVPEQADEDELVEYRVNSRHEDRDTDPVQPAQPIRHVSGARPRRDIAAIKQARDQRLRGVQRTMGGQDDELARGIKAYRSGARALDAFCAAMGYQKINQGRLLWAQVKLKVQEGA